MFKPHKGICICHGKERWITVKAGYCAEGNRAHKESKKTKNNTLKQSKIAYYFKQKGNVTKLKVDLDRVFSIYIRRRFADKNGMVKCFTSGKILHWGMAQCGHFISRRHFATRWDEINCQVQSVAENMFNQGNAPGFAKRLDEKYGAGTVDKLLQKKNNKFKLEAFILEALITEYKNKIKNLPQ